jgi:hypothetical protein
LRVWKKCGKRPNWATPNCARYEILEKARRGRARTWCRLIPSRPGSVLCPYGPDRHGTGAGADAVTKRRKRCFRLLANGDNGDHAPLANGSNGDTVPRQGAIRLRWTSGR